MNKIHDGLLNTKLRRIPAKCNETIAKLNQGHCILFFFTKGCETMAQCMHNDELYHYGVKGMKWGVRHDQKSGIYDERGFRTKKGHELEKARRKKLTPEQSDAELESLYKPNKFTSRHRLSAETKQYVADGYSGKTHTPELKKAMKDYRRAIKKGKEVYEKYRKQIDSLTLKELGYADTERGRQIIRDYWNETFF